MSDGMNINHAAEAVRILEGYPALVGNRPFDVAQVHATLAVAAAITSGQQHGAIKTPVAPSKHYCSDRGLLDMIESPQIPEADKPPMRVELAVRLIDRVKG